jgi:hypothetical protein
MGGVADDPNGCVAAGGEHPLEMQRNLSVPTRDYHAHRPTL